MADPNKIYFSKKKLNLTEISAAIVLSEQLADKLTKSPTKAPEDITLHYQDETYTAVEITAALSKFAFTNGWIQGSLHPNAKEIHFFVDQLNTITRDSQRPPEKQEGSIPTYITIPNATDPLADPIKITQPQVKKYLDDLHTQIKDIEKKNLETRLAEARQNIFASKSIIQKQVASVLSQKIPPEAVENIFKLDDDKFSAALEYAASVSGSQEELVSQTIDSFAQASLGGKFIANRLDDVAGQAVVAKSVNQFRDTGLYNQLTGSFGAIKELHALSDKLSGEHFIVGFYQNIIQSQPHLSHEQAVSQALKAYQALNLLSQTNQPLFLNPAKQHESFILSLKQSGVTGQSIQNIAFGNNAAPLNINELLIASYGHNQSAEYAKHKTTKQFTIPGGNSFNSRSMSLALQGGMSIFGLDGLLKDKKADGTKAADQINSVLDKHHAKEADELLSFLLKQPGALSFGQRSRGFALLKSRLGSFQDQARLILLINKLSPGTIPAELLSGAKFVTSPFRQAGGWVAQKASQAGIAVGKWFAQATTKAIQWLAVNVPKAVAAIGSGIGKLLAAVAAAIGPEILATVAICLVVIGVVILLAKITQLPLETAHIYPLPRKVGGGDDAVLQSKYVSIIKTPSLTSLADPTGKIEYSYTITPLMGEVTINSFTDTAGYINKAGNTPITLDKQPQTPPTTLTASFESDPFSLTLTSSMDDSLVINQITVDITTPEGPETVSANALTIIGNPPTGCYILADPPAPNDDVVAISWGGASDASSKELAAAAAIMGAFGGTNSTLCSGSINLYLATSGLDVDYGGWFLGGGSVALDYKFGSVGTSSNALYTLAHESGHVYDERSGMSGGAFRQAGFVTWNGNVCLNNIYPFPVYLDSAERCYAENFAEGFARYITGSLPSEWRTWYATNIFNK